ncbi:hypothetical protein COMA2_20497 [Candidatus Nitrospira nitrificans]|uniref:Uncharacterized protein n=1 Tax=Candidatus Nitrospira nitrificans TaxID=1742973 RepID=A0A0S4LE41_9BACT|nr:hypothetical protein COMA2_20497 [Candidatus Nitrospira nitrificans]
MRPIVRLERHAGRQNEMGCLGECREGHYLSGMEVRSEVYQARATDCRPGGTHCARFR